MKKKPVLILALALVVSLPLLANNPIPLDHGRGTWNSYSQSEKQAFIFGAQIATFMMSLAYELSPTTRELAIEKERLQRINEFRASDLVRHLDREILNAFPGKPLMDILYEIPERVFPTTNRQ